MFAVRTWALHTIHIVAAVHTGHIVSTFVSFRSAVVGALLAPATPSALYIYFMIFFFAASHNLPPHCTASHTATQEELRVLLTAIFTGKMQ
jgi:hypothetical protein